MSKYSIRKYDSTYFDRWNNFIKGSNNGTLFHRLDFLDYHKDKFTDAAHHLLWLKGEAIFAVMPMIVKEEENKGKIAISPFGGSFGGIATGPKTTMKHAWEAVQLLVDYFETNQIKEARIITAPVVYAEAMSENIDFALLANGFYVEKKDLFHIVELPGRKEEVLAHIEGRARTTLKKIGDDFDYEHGADINSFYPVLIQDKLRHDATATHSEAELKWLLDNFSEHVWIDMCTHKATGARAGICYFRTHANCLLTFYIAQEDIALGKNGPTFLLQKGMENAVIKGIKYFDFGSSSYGYFVQNMGVGDFKESFGARGFCRTTYFWQSKNTSAEK